MAKQATSATIKPGVNSPVFESNSGNADAQWIVAKGKVRSLDIFGEIPCLYFESTLHCSQKDIHLPTFTVYLDDNSFVFQVFGTVGSDGRSWMTYIGNCVSVPAD